MKYKPSSDLQRKVEEDINNHNRHVAWLKKSAIYRYHEKAFNPSKPDSMARYKDKHLLDVSDEQEPSDKDKVLSADPEFAKFLDSLDDENRAF